MNIRTFIAVDRLVAMTQGVPLPRTMRGVGLFGDISGFSELSDRLTKELGQQAGAEELTRQINHCYDELTAVVHRYHGSVVSFAGDSILCWFDEDAGDRALASAIAMQECMLALLAQRTALGHELRLRLKVALAQGEVVRFHVGDEAIQLLDILAGKLITTLADAEHQARPGEIVVAGELAKRLAARGSGSELRPSSGATDSFVVLSGSLLRAQSWPELAPWPALSELSIPEKELRPWLLPQVYRRMQAGQSEFLADLRLATALFVQFTCLDYDQDPAAVERLNGFIGWVQRAADRQQGTLLQVTLGDKGSYLYVVFGGPIAHEDDTERTLRLALELQRPPPELTWAGSMQMGISRGWMRAGAYGGRTRRTYGVQGEEVNLAARLMQSAAPSQILVSARVYEYAQKSFRFEHHGSLSVKGRAERVAAYRLIGRSETTHAPTPPARSSPLLGRARERRELQAALAQLIFERRGGAVLIEGDPGIGKSRLLEALVAAARAEGVRTYIGVAEPTEHAPYQAFVVPLMQLLQIPATSTQPAFDHAAHVAAQLTHEERSLMPLLNAVLPLGIPESAETSALSSLQRTGKTREYLAALIRQRARSAPLLLLIEDAHWLDSASCSLLLELGRSPECLLVVTSRPIDQPALVPSEYWRFRQAEHVQTLRLDPLSRRELCELIEETLGARSLPEPVLELIWRKSQGNPYFGVELARALRDQGIVRLTGEHLSLTPGADLAAVPIPETIHGAIVSRLDRLRPQELLLLKVGSAIGRSFRFQVLYEIYPLAEERLRLREQLELLQKLDFVLPAPVAENESSAERASDTYVFKHALIQDAAYQLMLSEQRWQIHRRIGEWYEHHAGVPQAVLDPLLAHHFGQAAPPHGQLDLVEKAIDYNQRAGEQAAARYANLEATRFLANALALLMRLPASRERSTRELRLRLARSRSLAHVYGLYSAQFGNNLEHARSLCRELDAQPELFWVLSGLAGHASARGDYRQALAVADELLALVQSPAAAPQRGIAHYVKGYAHFGAGMFVNARTCMTQASTDYIAGSLGNFVADPALQGRGFLAMVQAILGWPVQAAETVQTGLLLARQLNSSFHIGFLLMQQAMVHALGDDFAAAQSIAQQAWQLAQAGTDEAIVLLVSGLPELFAALTGVPIDVDRLGALLTARISAGLRMLDPWLHALHARALVGAGQYHAALRWADSGIALQDPGGGGWAEVPLRQWRGEALLALGHVAEGEAELARALELALRQQARLFALAAATSLARYRRAQGQAVEASRILHPQLACFTEGHAVPLLQYAATLCTQD